MEKYRTTGRLIILSLVTSLQERQRHRQFALKFLFATIKNVNFLLRKHNKS